MTTTRTGQRVIASDDDRDCPLMGVILGREDEDRVVVAWGDSIYADDPWRDSVVEWIDELTPLSGTCESHERTAL